MGGVISTASDYVVNLGCSYFCLEVNHICRLNKNLGDLEEAMDILRAKRDDVLRRVERDESTGLQRFNEVQLWLTNVGTIENEVHETRIACTRELQGLPFHEVCSKELDLRFRYGREVFSILEDVKELTGRKIIGDFIAVAGPPTRDVAEERPLQPIVGQDAILERAWNRLMDDETKILGLVGMGGIGKTTLLKQINNKFCEGNDGFDVVIWVGVSKDNRNEKIQDEIAKELGFLSTGGELWKQKTEAKKASNIRNFLKNKRFVLLLDDIWSKVELRDIGIPSPTTENKCKIVFTTRSVEVCGCMEVDNPIEVKCLESDDAWDLFRSKVRQTALECHPDIPQLARKVMEKCGGLPLALNIIGETMSSRRSIQEWRHAIDTLPSSQEILPILKYSYDSLKEDHVKSCFLYCSLFPEDYFLNKERLIEYWIGEEFIDEKIGRERALNQGYEILGTLFRACLLFEEESFKSDVKMHDVVRDMALWIASDLGKHKERCIVQAGGRLREIPKVKDWKSVRRMSFMKNDIGMISESHECPELLTLLLAENRSLDTISGEFFRCMPSLLVLDLSTNKNITELPKEISGLVSLRHLDLSRTDIKRLPVGVQELKMLILLDLESTRKLESLQGISNLSSLRTLKLQGSKVWLDMSLLKELRLLQHLEFVTIHTSSIFVGEQLSYDSRVGRCIQYISIEERSEESVRVLNLPTMANIRRVSIGYCKMEEIKIVNTAWNKSLTSPGFSNLSNVNICKCHGLKDLTWLLFAPNLSLLRVWESKSIVEIISEEKTKSLLEKGIGIIPPFHRLEFLELYNLPELKSIYWNALPFQRLNMLLLLDCPKLRKLPLDSKSVSKVENLVIKYLREEWRERVEWEDEATRQRFLPLFENLIGSEISDSE